MYRKSDVQKDSIHVPRFTVFGHEDPSIQDFISAFLFAAFPHERSYGILQCYNKDFLPRASLTFIKCRFD